MLCFAAHSLASLLSSLQVDTDETKGERWRIYANFCHTPMHAHSMAYHHYTSGQKPKVVWHEPFAAALSPLPACLYANLPARSYPAPALPCPAPPRPAWPCPAYSHALQCLACLSFVSVSVGNVASTTGQTMTMSFSVLMPNSESFSILPRVQAG